MVKQWQDMQYEGRIPTATMGFFTRLQEVSGSLWARVVSGEDLAELDDVLEAAFALKDKLVFVDIWLTPMSMSIPCMWRPNGAMDDMWLKKGVRT